MSYTINFSKQLSGILHPNPNMLKSTKEKMERQSERDNRVAFFEAQKENLKNMKTETLEDIAKKLEMYHTYEDEIAAAKQEYNNSQMFHIMDETEEEAEKRAKEAEKNKPKTEKERKEDTMDEALGTDDDKGMLTESLSEKYAKLLKEKSEEIFTKIKNGETENSYQIGSQSFTEKEWDEFLSKFDSLEDAIRKLMEEEQEKRAAEELEKEKEGDLLTADSTSCTYPAGQPDEEDIRYITWYTENGIFCRKVGQTEGYEWSISFENREQYEKVMSLIGQFPSDWNLRFAAHENFWRDFLDDKIDKDDFMDFMRGTSQGVPDFSITDGESVYVDMEKMKWAEYC